MAKKRITQTQAELLKMLPDGPFFRREYATGKESRTLYWLEYHGWVVRTKMSDIGLSMRELSTTGRQLRDELNQAAEAAQ